MNAGDRLGERHIQICNDLEVLLRLRHLPKQKTGEADGEQQQEQREAEDLGGDGLFESTDLRPDSILGGFHRSKEFRAASFLFSINLGALYLSQGGENI